jgi:hypothetical protein
VLVAIDSKGEQRKRVKLLPEISYDHAKRWLEELLDRVDPVPVRPKLELVRDTPSQRRERRPHPAHADDRRAYQRRLVQQAARKIRYFRD